MKISIAVALIATSAPILACSSRTEKAAPEPTASSASLTVSSADVTKDAPVAAANAPVAALTEVTDPTQVCMVNNQFMGVPQIPTEVGGKTYYGCCAMCKGKLEKDPKARTGTDPVSGHPVDKASAVIGKNDTGAVFYFQSRENLLAYKP